MSSWYPYSLDSRGNRMGGYKLTRLSDDSRFVYLQADKHMAAQVERALTDRGCYDCSDSIKPDEDFTHKFGYQAPAPDRFDAFLRLLCDIVTIPVANELDAALVLDFYKDPSSHEDPMHWDNTPAGGLINLAKYQGSLKGGAGSKLANKLAEVIDLHPVYRAAGAIITVPGHDPNSIGFGVRLAVSVAGRTGQQPVETQSSGSRPQAKETGFRDPVVLSRHFVVPDTARGKEVIIVDDVYRSGSSMRAVALAARRAGAVAVYGLAGARTMRSR